MSVKGARNFDLNIEEILERWDVRHAIRELIANALDQRIFSTRKMPTFEWALAPGGSDSMRRLGPNQAFHRYRSSSIHPQSNC
jgi:hypothetical protein